MARSHVVLAIVMVMVVTVVAATPPPPPPPSSHPSNAPDFPLQFTSSYTLMNSDFGQNSNSSGVIYYDFINQRCRMSSRSMSIFNPWLNIEQLAIDRPPNAQPNTAMATGLTFFNYGPYGSSPNFPCLYSSQTSETQFQITTPFPRDWFGGNRKPQIGLFWNSPFYLYWNGTSTLDGISIDRWASSVMCEVFNQPPAPCSVLEVDHNTQLPIRTIYLQMRRPNSFENDIKIVYRYYNFVASAPDSSKFELPTNWVSIYRNANNGVRLDHDRGQSYSIVTPQKDLTILVSLRTAPISSLGGQVVLTVVTQPTVNFPCTTCVKFSPNKLIFNEKNWHTPQPIQITYLNAGNQQLNYTLSDGGYDYVWTYNYSDVQYNLGIYACANGTTGVSCQWPTNGKEQQYVPINEN